MSELLKERPLAVWGLFLAGAIVGGLSSALVQPQSADAVPQGLPHANARDIQEVKSLLGGISKTEEGGYVFDAPVEFKDSTEMVELLVIVRPESLQPALSVTGPAQFESAVGPSCVVLNDHGVDYPEPDFAGPALKVEGPSLFTGDPGERQSVVKVDPIMLHDVPVLLVNGPSKFTGTSGDDPLMTIMPLELEGPALRVEGVTKLITPEIHPENEPILAVDGASEFVGKVGLVTPEIHPEDEPLLSIQGPVSIDPLLLMPTIPALSILGLDRATSINPDAIELRDISGSEAEVLGVFKIQQDGTSLLKTDTVEAVLVKETGGPF